MKVINTVNQQRFSLDGIEYFKNFLSKVYGNKITIYNAYDSCDVLVEVELFSNIILNGVVYGSVALLQQALLPVIYTRDSLNGLVSSSSLFNYFNNVEGFNLAGQDLTVNANWAWTINGTPYTNTSSVLINVPLATTGKHRLDIVVSNQNNTFELIQGVEVLLSNSPAEPPVPNGKLRATSLLVTEGTVSNPTNPTIGSSQFLGNYNALGNIPFLIDGVGNAGDYYTVTVAGNGYEINDRIEYNGTAWVKSVNNNQNTSGGVSVTKTQLTYTTSGIFTIPQNKQIISVIVGELRELNASKYTYNSAGAINNFEITDTAFLAELESGTEIEITLI